MKRVDASNKTEQNKRGRSKCRFVTTPDYSVASSIVPKLTDRDLLVKVGRALTGLPTLLPRAPNYMCQHERELNEKIVDPYYHAIAKARGIILFESDIPEDEIKS